MYRIRPAGPADALALAELGERTFRAAFASQNSAEDIDAHCRKSYGRDIQAAEIADASRTTLVCEADGGLVAYGQLRRNHAPRRVVAGNPAEIQRLHVDSAWHGK